MMIGSRLVVTVVGAFLLLGASTASGVEAEPAAPPGRVLISETSGEIWSYDIGTGVLAGLETVGPGNFDIQFVGPKALLIGNLNGFVSQLDLTSGQETLVTDNALLTSPLGVAVSPRSGGYYYFADLVIEDESIGRIFAFDVDRGELDLLLETDGGVENVAIDKKGMVYFTNGPRLGRFDPLDPTQVEEVAVIDGAYLSGLVVTSAGHVFVASSGSPGANVVGVFRVQAQTGQVNPLHLGEPLRNPEDVALAPNGDLYILDSAYLQPPENFVPGLYRLPRDGGEIEALYTGDPLGDIVDLLVTPFRGY